MIDYWKFRGRALRVRDAAAASRESEASSTDRRPSPEEAFVLRGPSGGRESQVLDGFLRECGLAKADRSALTKASGNATDGTAGTLGFDRTYDLLVDRGLACPRPASSRIPDFEAFERMATLWEHEFFRPDFDAKSGGRLNEVLKGDDSFVAAWLVEGMEGGGIETDAYRVTGRAEPPLDWLVSILRTTDVRLADVGRFEDLETREREENVGYYGNGDTYAFKHVRFADAYDLMAELGLVDPRPGAAPAP